MNVGLYAKINRNIITGFADGVLALGHSPVWQNPAFFSPRETAPFDFIAIWGGAGPKSREVISTYDRFNIKALVFENGYVGENTHAISIGKHYWLPEFECPSDRMDKFGLKLTQERKEDGYILVLGQSAEINSLLAKQVKELKTNRKIVFRPHPSVDFKISGFETLKGSFAEALSGAYCVLCHTSNSANDALKKGIPVFCSHENMAAECGNTNIEDIDNPYFPDDEKLTGYFSRLCYAVWTEDEIRNGKAFKFYSAIIKGETPVHKGVTSSVQDLRGKYAGQTAYIIGKGPSLKHLTKDHFIDGGLVIPLNEAIKIAENIGLSSDFSIISQQKDGKPECMVKPKRAPLLLHEKESKGWFDNHVQRYIFDLKKDYGLKNNGISVVGGNCCSAIAAIEFAKFTGCKKIVFMCFDFLVNGDNSYPDHMGDLYEDPNRLEHLKAMKKQVNLHVKKIEHEFITPELIKQPFTVITLTGDRPESFRLCKTYMARQTVQPEQWIVVDDGKKMLPKKDRSGCEYHRRKALKTDPIHTLRVNLLEALKHVKTDTVVIMEDDDWYRPDYFMLSLKYLEDYDLVGQNTFFYWNLRGKAFHIIKKTNRPAMCLTGFNRPAFKTVKQICKNSPEHIASEVERERIDKGSVDLSLWKRFSGKKSTYDEGDNVCVGIKGVKGREGHTLGHVMAVEDYFEPDPDAKMLKKLIGSDVKNYIEVN